MAKVTGLTGELRKQVTELEKDLRARVDGAEEFARQEGVAERWHVEYEAALKAERTAASWQEWRDERVIQAAVAWVLLTVFARFCEDNELVSTVWIAGPSRQRRQEALDARRSYFQTNPEHNDRDWLSRIVEHFGRFGATAGLVDDYSPLHQVAPSGDAARKLLEFWWEQDSEGELLRSFGPEDNPELDTRFLGDLYQDLSEFAQKTYALLQTPEFVEEFILDQTFEPAIAERPLEGFSVIDPTCGSGHFLLGAFHRLLDRWSKHAPNLDSRALVQKALDGVHGVDINPFAVAIARFRLIIAALQATGELSLENVPDFQLKVAAGDALIFGAREQALESDLLNVDQEIFSYSVEDLGLLKELLQREHDVVVGNPPYITAKDKALNAAYRKQYNYCKGTYALTVPFMELFFNMARGSGRSGWVGQITSNSFMKREFGKPLIEKFLKNKDLRAVIDTSGAYIPGHGTPTVIMVGRNQARVDDTVRAVLGVRGEPGRPENAAKGLVWSSIVNHVDESGFEDDWITVSDLNRELLNEHPWSLTGGGAVELAETLSSQQTKLSGQQITIGRTTHTGADDAFYLPHVSTSTLSIESEVVPVVLGEDVRDFAVNTSLSTLFPYDEEGQNRDVGINAHQVLWRNKNLLSSRVDYQQTLSERGLRWFDHSMFFKKRYRVPLSITFAFVATHNHFVLDRGGKVFKQSAPVIKLPEGATEDEHLKLLGVLNSSVACFWLKQNSHDKGVGGIGGGIGDEAWEPRYEFTGTTLKDFPLPKELPLDRARRIDELAQELVRYTPQAVAEAGAPTREALDAAYAEHERIRAQMIAVQEELDWESYRLYGLLDEDLTYAGELPGLALGERAFEIVLARAIRDGEDTAWFDRHGSTPITEIPEHWPEDYRELVQRRLDVIAGDRNIRLLEKPEHKRRWSIEPWDKRVQAALKEWLLDKLEERSLWFDRQGRPRPQSVAQLADRLGRDEEFVSVLELWVGSPDVPVATSLQQLLADQPVPFLAAYRYKESGMDKRAAWEETWRLQRKEDAGETLDKPIPVPPKYKPADFAKPHYWQHRGKLDVPKERFIGYPDAGRETDTSPLLGWAGWDHAQQALALATIMNKRAQEGWSDEGMVPLIAGLAELQPWVRQWHGEIDPTYGVSLAAIVDEELESRRQRAGKTLDELAAWRPAAPARGRKKNATKQAQTTQGETE
ncbi:BREX-2 system adenine-specific DNA-methyltransferase PglX [Actinopolyspora saharensis]|uniref:site-specific DNA-methyltransferase (adenine-specific) n=1 Tax=Actinopolyspora saharensis TaxID=995062 RepID=A0A1H0YHY7_9ACTN|nr:BREX-2 system adenine-specific DNA-methyltransferase PglX [Actinopolyspora saharensis]SDQ14834.1 Methyltransferase domain-containing protein [Actinopolyspora saharensis]